MIKVSVLGKNLNVVIETKYSFYNDWKAFALWYSITKHAPDANIIIYCKLEEEPKTELFIWAKRLKIKLTYKKPNINCLYLNDNFIMVREFDEQKMDSLTIESISCGSKSEDFKQFINYDEGVGKFNNYAWINISDIPFISADSFMINDMTINEVKILQLWKKMANVYHTVSGV